MTRPFDSIYNKPPDFFYNSDCFFETDFDKKLGGKLSSIKTDKHPWDSVEEYHRLCQKRAARAFLVFKAVEELGQIVVYRPSSQDIEDEKFENDFTFYLTTDADLETVLTTIRNVSEIDEAVGEEVKSEALFAASAKAEEEAAKQDAAKAAPAAPAPQKTEAPAKKETTKAAAKNKSGGRPVTSRTVRVDIEKLDALMNQVSELIIAKNSLVSISSSDGGNFQNQSFHEQIEYLERITTSLHESVMKVRMVPIESVVNKFPRMIRDLSRKLNKKMELVMSGEDTELDRTVVDQIGDPLQHLLRNSADHGLESAELRKERGKPETGTIRLNAFQEGNNVIIEVGDDGNGIDTERVKSKAIERGLVTEEQAEKLTQKEIIDFLFMPSFSMAKTITDISGRGVGLDVVKTMVEKLKGTINVTSERGKGSKFSIRLPLTLAIIQGLLVRVGKEVYSIPVANVIESQRVKLDTINTIDNYEVLNVRNEVISILRLGRLFNIRKTDNDEYCFIVIVGSQEKKIGVMVDALIGEEDVVIKPLQDQFTSSPGIAGATVLGDGSVSLILLWLL